MLGLGSKLQNQGLWAEQILDMKVFYSALEVLRSPKQWKM